MDTNSNLSLPPEDERRLAIVRERLNTAVVGDVLDLLDRPHCLLPPEIRPLRDDMVLAGRAMPVLIADVFGPQPNPFGRLTEALDQLRPGEIYLARGGRVECAAWGEILTATARMRGACGAVIDGYHRDTSRVLSQEWPVFSRGCYAQDAGVRSSVIDFRVPIEIGAVAIRPGDLVIGDRDGVLVVPRDLEDEALERAMQKVAAEQVVRAAIEGGMSSTDAFKEYGVL